MSTVTPPTIIRPAVVPAQYTLALGWFVYFHPPGVSPEGPEGSILNGMRVRNWSMGGITYNMIDNNDQQNLEVFIRQVATTANPGTFTANVFFDPRRQNMPEVSTELNTINHGDYGKATLAVRDQNNTTSTNALVVMQSDAVLQGLLNLSANFGEIIYHDYVFQLCGKPELFPIEMEVNTLIASKGNTIQMDNTIGQEALA